MGYFELYPYIIIKFESGCRHSLKCSGKQENFGCYCYCCFIFKWWIIPNKLLMTLMLAGIFLPIKQLKCRNVHISGKFSFSFSNHFFCLNLTFFPPLLKLRETRLTDELRQLEWNSGGNSPSLFFSSCPTLPQRSFRKWINTTPSVPLSFYVQLLKLALSSLRVGIRSIFKLCSESSTLLNQC